MQNLTSRQKAICAGLFLSKFDKAGLAELGFRNATEAFNVIGAAVNIKRRSVQNYRDEFDPYFPNERVGRHKRPMMANCEVIFNAYKDLGFEEFTALLKQIIYGSDIEVLLDKVETDGGNTFAKRLLTGQAAENYFRQAYREIDEFQNYQLEDTTKLGCGFDFKLHNPGGAGDFLGIEVKGLGDATGSIALTSKEHLVAGEMRDRYYLFVVRNFNHEPFHDYFCNPLHSKLRFTKSEQIVKQISWTASIR